MQKQIIVRKNENIVVPLVWAGKYKQLAVDIVLAEPGASCDVLGLLLGKQQNELFIDAKVRHAAPNTRSNIVIRGALKDQAKINFEGLVKIEPGAKGTNAWLAAHILLLSNQAKGRAIPSLEILENDVKAGHATTVGKIDELQLFYLMSRGLSQEQAKKLIVEGFLQSIINKLPKKEQMLSKKSLEHYAI